MSAVPESVRVGELPPQQAAAVRAKSAGEEARAPTLYVGVLIAATAAIAGALYLRTPADRHAWATFVALAAAATVAQAFPIKSPRNTMYHTSVVFLVAATLLLSPRLLVLIPLLQSVPAWLRARRASWQDGFDIANYTLDALAAWGTARLVARHAGGLGADSRFALAGLAACLAFVAAHRLLAAGLLRAGGDAAIRESGRFSLDGLSVDLVLTMLGISLAAFWLWDRWLVFAALAPLVVVHRSLSVPQLQEEARIDPKTGLYNARYFAAALKAELVRAARFGRPMAVIMADLDLLRELNNSYGHLAGDGVLRGIAETFAAELRHYDVAARFGGEEFSILLPETDAEAAQEIAERIRRCVAEREFEVATAPEPLRATLSMGVAVFPDDGVDADELIHQADLAVYRAKLQGRNRVLAAAAEPLLTGADPARPRPGPTARLQVVPDIGALDEPATVPPEAPDDTPQASSAASSSLVWVAALAGLLGIGGGVVALVTGGTTGAGGVLALAAVVAAAQAVSFELTDVGGSISVGVVGSLAGAALFGYRAALPLALAAVAVDWGARRLSAARVLPTAGAFTLASLASAGLFSLGFGAGRPSAFAGALLGVAAGAAYFVVTMALQSVAAGLELQAAPWTVFQERYAWLLPHYLVYGFVGAVIAIAYDAVGLYALGAFAVPLVLMRKTQEAYLRHTDHSSQRLRAAAETIRAQNASLERANELLRERSTAAMESLSATVDARDSYTAGHARRVRELALALGRELGLSQAELGLLDRAALFHDIGKLAVPDAILLKPGPLTPKEWEAMESHAVEGARIIERLGFLQDAVPAIRHHHERWDGRGYPDRLAGDEIPLGARIIHVADALDSMLTTRHYRAARPLEEALAEIRAGAGDQFCPRCVAALERLVPLEAPVGRPARAVAVP
jgi:diguanylate cyclase (GGDEF)-like protein/putative nucleotidyltransferase with HDIG domain